MWILNGAAVTRLKMMSSNSAFRHKENLGKPVSILGNRPEIRNEKTKYK